MRPNPFANPDVLMRRVYAYVAYRIGDGPEAEDVTSETFERALRYRDSFDARRGDPAAWLIGIARRCIADAVLERTSTTDETPQLASDDHSADILRRIELRHAVAQLDERDRELVALRYGADLTARQIGELLELKTNAVEVALHRALKTMRAALEAPPPRRGIDPVDKRWVTQQP
jgi:RNA polymerase sigma-70 factor (ECF subfamily)